MARKTKKIPAPKRPTRAQAETHEFHLDAKDLSTADVQRRLIDNGRQYATNMRLITRLTDELRTARAERETLQREHDVLAFIHSGRR